MDNKNIKKILIFGSSGMAGNTIATYLSQKGHSVTGFSRKSSDTFSTIIGDATDSNLVLNTIIEGKYDCIINCIGILNQFAESNKETAVYLNSYFPHQLVSLTKDMKTKVILMSTDCVFSGEKGGYKESDFPDGKTFYDRSKALGEVNDNKNLTIRTSIVGPDINEKGIGLLNWFMKQNEPIKGFTKAMWTGITTLQLAKVMEKAIIDDAVGLVNMVYKESINKFDLLQLFNKYLRNDELIIEPNDVFISDKSLIRTNFDFNYEIPSYEMMISEMANWITLNKAKYLHYKL